MTGLCTDGSNHPQLIVSKDKNGEITVRCQICGKFLERPSFITVDAQEDLADFYLSNIPENYSLTLELYPDRFAYVVAKKKEGEKKCEN